MGGFSKALPLLFVVFMVHAFKQVELLETASESRMTCWIPVSDLKDIKVGSKVELVGLPNRIWHILCIYGLVVKDLDIQKKWGLRLSKKERTEA